MRETDATVFVDLGDAVRHEVAIVFVCGAVLSTDVVAIFAVHALSCALQTVLEESMKRVSVCVDLIDRLARHHTAVLQHVGDLHSMEQTCLVCGGHVHKPHVPLLDCSLLALDSGGLGVGADDTGGLACLEPLITALSHSSWIGLLCCAIEEHGHIDAVQADLCLLQTHSTLGEASLVLLLLVLW